MLLRLTSSPLFGMTVCIIAYLIGQWVYGKLRTPLANPFAIAVALVILLLFATETPYERFYHGGRMLTLFLGPATAALAVSIYRNREVLKRAAMPVVVGCMTGSFVSLVSVYYWCQWMGLDGSITVSLMPKSVTTPIAVSLVAEKGGLEELTAAGVCMAGMTGALLFASLLRILKIRNPIAEGVAMGTASHAIGTAKAAELGEVQGAISGIAIGVAGLVTTVMFMVVSHG